MEPTELDAFHAVLTMCQHRDIDRLDCVQDFVTSLAYHLVMDKSPVNDAHQRKRALDVVSLCSFGVPRHANDYKANSETHQENFSIIRMLQGLAVMDCDGKPCATMDPSSCLVSVLEEDTSLKFIGRFFAKVATDKQGQSAVKRWSVEEVKMAVSLAVWLGAVGVDKHPRRPVLAQGLGAYLSARLLGDCPLPRDTVLQAVLGLGYKFPRPEIDFSRELKHANAILTLS